MPRARATHRLATLVALAVLAWPAAASGHGDPSSHYLETEQLYPGFANRPSQDAELALLGLLEAARRDGYPIKVSIVGSRDDVTEDPAVVEHPQAYAETVAGLLGRPNVKAPVVILTQHGIGISGVQPRDGQARLVTRAKAARLRAGVAVARDADGDALAAAAERVIRTAAADAGHELPADVAPAKVLAPVRDGGDGGGPAMGIVLPAVIFAGVFLTAWLYYELRSRRARRRSTPADQSAL